MTFGITENGFVAPTEAELITQVRQEYQARLRIIEENSGLTLDYSADIFLGNITGIAGSLMAELAEVGQGVYDAWDVNNATGVQLDNLCAIIGVGRKGATKSTATVTISGTPGTVIASGLQVEGGGPEDRSRWTVSSTVTIPTGGTVDVTVVAVDSGSVAAVSGQIDSIVTPIQGWDSVTNAIAASTGLDREKNGALRQRRQQSTQIAAQGPLDALLGNLLALSFVTDAAVVENVTGNTTTIQGLSMPSHSFSCIVAPGSLTADQEQEVAQVIYKAGPIGIQSVGSFVNTTVTGRDGQPKAINFNYSTPLVVTIQLSLRPEPGFTYSAILAAAQESIADYFALLGIGGAARRLDLYGLLDKIAGIQQAVVTLNNVDADVEPFITQKIAYNVPLSTFKEI